MSKAILISIKPEWVAKILNGEKTIEARKGITLYKVINKLIEKYGEATLFMYCTKDNKRGLYKFRDNFCFREYPLCFRDGFGKLYKSINGKVVAKFTCKKVEKACCYDTIRTSTIKQTCLTSKELWDYAEALATLLYISNLVVFDEPKELSEFKHYNKPHCDNCPFQYSASCEYHIEVECDDIPLTKAPQSWCYVEELL